MNEWPGRSCLPFWREEMKPLLVISLAGLFWEPDLSLSLFSLGGAGGKKTSIALSLSLVSLYASLSNLYMTYFSFLGSRLSTIVQLINTFAS